MAEITTEAARNFGKRLTILRLFHQKREPFSMSMPEMTFSPGSISAPTGPAAPTVREVKAMGQIAMGIGHGGRATLMNQICRVLNMPPEGWSTGQSHLFERGDIRLAAMLGTFTKDHVAKAAAENLQRAAKVTQANIMLAAVTAAREHSGALTATGRSLIDSYHEGGLDCLGDQKNHLGLPESITREWKPIVPFVNPESMHVVHPAWIPVGDQMVIYAAQVAASYRLSFMKWLQLELADDALPAVARASRVAIMIWQAYTFLAPGGRSFEPAKDVAAQLGQSFGVRSALGFVADHAKKSGDKADLNLVVNEDKLNRSAWVRSAKTRTAEALFLERLLKQARLMLPA